MVSKAETIISREYVVPKLTILGINSDIITDSPETADAILVDFWE